MTVKSKASKADAVAFLEELRELLGKYKADISCRVVEGQFDFDAICFDLNETSVCEFYNPACVSAGEIEALLRNKPLGHRWLIEGEVK